MKSLLSTITLLIYLNASSVFGQPADIYSLSSQILDLAKSDTNSWIQDLMSIKYSFIGQYKKSIQTFDLVNDEEQGIFPELSMNGCKVVDARKYITDRSKREKVIIINEAHYQPLHRIFTTSLLDDLWRNGYRYFGLEGVADAALINKRKKVEISDGFYTSEPQFANMIRYAIKVGFTLFSYEAVGKNNKQREQEQAANIAKMMKTHPNGKYLIHCGFSHIVEDNHPEWGKAMAGRLKMLSGYDPFTVDQVEMSERSLEKYESTAFRQLNVDRPSVIIKSDNSPYLISNDKRKIDLKVVHARTIFTYGRPTWLLLNENYHYVDAKKYFSNHTFPALIFAYKKEDNDTNVPVDVIELKDPNDSTQLVLPIGIYKLKLVSQKDTLITNEVISK